MDIKLNLNKSTAFWNLIIGLLFTPLVFFNWKNIISGEGLVGLGAIPLGGALFLPISAYLEYKRGKCSIYNDYIIIGKNKFNYSEYSIDLTCEFIKFTERNIFTPFKKNSESIVIISKNTGSIDCDYKITKSQSTLLKNSIPNIINL